MTWTHQCSRHTRRTWVFACSWTRFESGELSATLGLGKWSVHVHRREAA